MLLAVIDIARLVGRTSEAAAARTTLANLAVRTEQPYMLSRLGSDRPAGMRARS